MKIKTIISFIVGAAVGSTATYFITKKMNEKHINDEIREAKEHYKQMFETADKNPSYMVKDEPTETETTDADKVDEEAPLVKPSVVTDRTRYDKVKEKILNENKPFEIDADTYCWQTEFKKRVLTYYKDNFLVNEKQEPVTNILACIGMDMFNRIKDPNIDILYVRNEKERCDYEISKQPCKFDMFKELIVNVDIKPGSKRPYTISQADFEDSEYESMDLALYKDGILADDNGDIYIIDSTIGTSALNSFGEYTDGTVYVRNEGSGYDYSVYKEQLSYRKAFPDAFE